MASPHVHVFFVFFFELWVFYSVAVFQRYETMGSGCFHMFSFSLPLRLDTGS